MKRILLFFLVLSVALTAGAQQSLYQQYIEKYKDMATEQMRRYGIPASITLAQGLLESGAGTSMLATKANNHFGIKTGGNWAGPYVVKDDDKRGEHFRKYDSAKQSYEDHSLFLSTRGRYSSLFKLSQTDYKGWAHGLKAAGYATNPEYAQKLISIIEIYNLQQYDKAAVPSYKTATASTGTRKSTAQDKGRDVAPLVVGRANGRYYVVARPGDTFATIAREMNADERKLRKYNEVPASHRLSAGDVVYLQKKRSHVAAPLRGKYHVIAAGESLYTISQQYGVKIKTLLRANDITGAYTPRVGNTLLLK